MEKMNDLKDLLRHEIQDLYSAEEQIIEALPKMINKATNRNLVSALNEHLDITRKQKDRLDQIQKLIGDREKEKGKKGLLSGLFGKGKHSCKAMKGIIEEGNTILAEDMSNEVRDAAVIACAQKVEHYEICGYGTARTYARELGMEKVAQLLEQTLNEEYEADKKLTALAVDKINRKAEAGMGSGRAAAEKPLRKDRTAVRREELEPVSSRRGGTASKTAKESAGRPAGSPRNQEKSRSTPSSRTNAAGRSKSASSKASSRSGNSGRTSGSNRRGSGSR